MAEWNQCWYCGHELKKKWERTADHVVPESKGGRLLVTACFACNNRKADMSLDSYRRLAGQEQFYGERHGWQPW